MGPRRCRRRSAWLGSDRGFAAITGAVEDLRPEYRAPALSALDPRLAGARRPPTLELAPQWKMNPFLPDGTFAEERTWSRSDPDASFQPFALAKGDQGALEAICRRIRR